MQPWELKHLCLIPLLMRRYSEQSKTRCIGMTIETRPDYCLTPHLSAMLSYGCTRLEIGLQSTYEDVARDTNRGHTVAAVGECFQLAKDAGFKVRRCGHLQIVHVRPRGSCLCISRMSQCLWSRGCPGRRPHDARPAKCWLGEGPGIIP